MVYGGEGSYHYFFYESGGFKAGDPSSDQNIPFNPPTPGVAFPKPKYSHERIDVYSKKNAYAYFSKELVPGESALGEMVFKDPWLLGSIFTHRVKGGVWVSGTGTLLFDFTDDDDDLTIGIQYHIHDQEAANHLNRVLTGGDVTQYVLIGAPGEFLKENATVKTVAFATNTQVMSLSNDFHDQEFGSGIGGFANWDDSGIESTGKRSIADIIIHLDDAVLTGLDIQEFTLTIDIGKNSKQTADSKEHTKRWLGLQDFSLEITGALADLSEILEAEKEYASQTKRTLKFYIDSAVGEEKFIQVTNVFLESGPDDEIPGPNDIWEGTIMLKGGSDSAISFSGSYVDRPDPGILVPNTP